MILSSFSWKRTKFKVGTSLKRSAAAAKMKTPAATTTGAAQRDLLKASSADVSQFGLIAVANPSGVRRDSKFAALGDVLPLQYRVTSGFYPNIE